MTLALHPQLWSLLITWQQPIYNRQHPLIKGCINGNIHPLCTVYEAYFSRQCSGFLHKDNNSPSHRLEDRQVKECLKSEQIVKYSLAFAHLLDECQESSVLQPPLFVTSMLQQIPPQMLQSPYIQRFNLLEQQICACISKRKQNYIFLFFRIVPIVMTRVEVRDGRHISSAQNHTFKYILTA